MIEYWHPSYIGFGKFKNKYSYYLPIKFILSI